MCCLVRLILKHEYFGRSVKDKAVEEESLEKRAEGLSVSGRWVLNSWQHWGMETGSGGICKVSESDLVTWMGEITDSENLQGLQVEVLPPIGQKMQRVSHRELWEWTAQVSWPKTELEDQATQARVNEEWPIKICRLVKQVRSSLTHRVESNKHNKYRRTKLRGSSEGEFHFWVLSLG